eukprot:g29131.t1
MPKPKPAPKKEEKPPQALTVTVTRFSTWEDDEPQRLRLELMTNTKVAELRTKLGELCMLDDKEVKKMKLIKRKKASFLTAQETENVSNEIFAHNIDKWPTTFPSEPPKPSSAVLAANEASGPRFAHSTPYSGGGELAACPADRE